MHDSCMATKTISIEIDAYERLSNSKGPGESFSDVVRRAVFPKTALTGSLLLAHLKKRGAILSEEALDEMSRVHDTLNQKPDDPWTEIT